VFRFGGVASAEACGARSGRFLAPEGIRTNYEVGIIAESRQFQALPFVVNRTSPRARAFQTGAHSALEAGRTGWIPVVRLGTSTRATV